MKIYLNRLHLILQLLVLKFCSPNVTGSSGALEVYTLNSAITTGDINHFNKHRPWGDKNQIKTEVTLNPRLCLETDYVSTASILKEANDEYISQPVTSLLDIPW